MPVHHSPIKENDPPIQDLQIAAKTSGPSNLSREGWDEDQCRNFLVRVLDWVPRNFNYDDGLRVIHPHLQERFGDENMDLACGVLDELIEIDNYNPFPGAAFQRWKYTHRNRHDNFQLPHVPHTTTIMAQVVPTRRLLEWRARNNTPTTAETTHLSPTSSTFKTGISTVTHRSAWRIEHTLFVSTGGGRATVHYCPSPEEFHMRLWDPNYGRAGNPAPQKSHSQSQSLIRIGFMAEAPVTGRSSEGNALFNSEMTTVSPKIERKRARAQTDHSIVPAVGFRDAVYEDLSAHRHLPKPGTKFAHSTIPNVPLPHGVQIPNAIFGRKHHLVPQGIPLPADFVKGQVQPTAGLLGVAKAEHLLALAESAVVESHKANDMNENNRKERDESIMKEYFTYFNGPFTADLFYDGGLDFRWLSPSKDLTPQTLDVDCSPSTSAKKKGFFSRSPANKKSGNSSPGGAPSRKASKDSLAAQRKENRRKQITTVQGTPQLVNLQPKKHVFRDSRFFKAFQRKSIATSPKMEQVPSFGRDSAQVDPADSRGSKAIGPASDLDRIETGILRFSGQKFKMLLPPSSIEDEDLSRPDSNTLPAETRVLSSSSLPETPNKQQTTRVSRKELSNYSIGTTMSSSDTPKTPTHQPRRRSRADHLSRTPLREVHPRAPLRKASGNVIANEHLTLQPKVFDNRKLSVDDLVSGRRKKLDSDLKLNSFDGAGDESFTPDRKAADVDQNNAQSLSNNTHYLRDGNYLDPHNIKQSMDPTRNFAHRSAQPPPLQIRKQSVTHLRAATKQRIRNNSNPERSPTGNSFLPQRTSSIIKSRRVEDSETSFQTKQTDTASTLVDNSQSSTKTRAIVPDNSSDIMGDFIALDGNDARGYQDTTTDDDIALLNVAAKHRYPKPIHNPYEFEKSPLLDRLDDEGHLATFRNFMREQEAEPVQPLRKSPHVKNSRSEGNTGWITITHEPTPTVNISTKPKVNNFHRSESSPVVSPTREPSLQDPLPSTEHDFLSHYYAEDELSGSPARHSRQLVDTFRKDRRVMEDSLNASTSNLSHNYRAASRSPTRRARQDNLHESYSSSSSQHYTSNSSDPRSSNPRSSSSTTNRQHTKSPTKALDDVDETEEFDARTPRPRAVTEAHSSPPKRTRSPMKKMFGENGWLTHSPIIKQEPYPSLKKPTPKKTSMMGRIKNKFGEIAEKADMSPMRRSERERRPAQSLITRSITPFEQARIYTELELMMVHTANLFLMNQFSEARIAIDTIRKTIDGWKSKGRLMVIEFMYDQVTQRNLVALNQHSMRFHGPGSGDDMRVSSMLYSWKQVANIMSIRTFCDTDPVILKLLFDIENILELLGAGEPFMVRLQDISRGVKETIVRARHKKEMEDAKTHSRGQRAAPNNDFRSDTPPRGRSMSTPYNDPPGSYHG